MVTDWFIEKGIRRVEIEVVVANEVSNAFWSKMNFRPYKKICYCEL